MDNNGKTNTTVIIETTRKGRTAYRVGFNASNGSDFKCFVATGGDLMATIAAVYPSSTHNVTVIETSFSKWLKGAKA